MIDPPCDSYMIDGIKVTEKEIFRTKVGLFARISGKSSHLGEGGMLHAGSHVWLDQKEPNGHYSFMCFKPHDKKYITVPESYFWEHLERARAKDMDLID
jgi:hypothetical protein